MTTVLPDDLFLHNLAFLRTRTRLQVVHLLLTEISEELSESSDVELCRDPNLWYCRCKVQILPWKAKSFKSCETVAGWSGSWQFSGLIREMAERERVPLSPQIQHNIKVIASLYGTVVVTKELQHSKACNTRFQGEGKGLLHCCSERVKSSRREYSGKYPLVIHWPSWSEWRASFRAGKFLFKLKTDKSLPAYVWKALLKVEWFPRNNFQKRPKNTFCNEQQLNIELDNWANRISGGNQRGGEYISPQGCHKQDTTSYRKVFSAQNILFCPTALLCVHGVGG